MANLTHRDARGEQPACPDCGAALHRVRNSGWMNDDQFDAVRVGDYYCPGPCKGTRGKFGLRYFWEHELSSPLPDALPMDNRIMTIDDAVAHLEVIADEDDRFVDKVDRSAIQALLTAYAAQAADSKRLERLMNLEPNEILQVRATWIRSPLWDKPATRFDALRSAIDYCLGIFAPDAALSGTGS